MVHVEEAGIRISDLSRIFEAFFTTKVKAWALGLAICQSIIAAHGGGLVDEGGLNPSH